MLNKLINALSEKLSGPIKRDMDTRIDDVKLLIGQQLARDVWASGSFHDSEFRVFSQWGDDGLIQYLIRKIPQLKPFFIEFGVENYTESNTRFLLQNNNWEGLLIDGNSHNIQFIKNDPIYWKYSLIAKSAFVTAENINELIASEGFSGEIGLLHIDIDGNEYWVWKAIEVVDPTIVIVEYNSIFGVERAITVPYDESFVRSEAHYSNLYAGASLKALLHLGRQKDYTFIGCNSAGNNAYFVKNERLNGLHEKSLEDGYVKSKFRESRDRTGQLSYLSYEAALASIRGMEVFNIEENKIEQL